MTATLSESHDAPSGLPGRLDQFIAGLITRGTPPFMLETWKLAPAWPPGAR